VLKLGYRSGEVTDLRLTYQTMLAYGAHIDQKILNQSLASFNLILARWTVIWPTSAP